MKSKRQVGIDIFSGKNKQYDTFRIEPPDVIVEILNKTLGYLPKCVVDLGCGTGLSSQLWMGYAEEVIGIEPNSDMRQEALKRIQKQTSKNKTHVRIEDGSNSNTGLLDHSVDLVTCSQSLHWMEPASTHKEILRILKPGGVLAAFSYAMPPTIHPNLEQEFQTVLYQANVLVKERKLWEGLESWPIVEHHQYMKELDDYGYTKEIWFHQKMMGNADDFMGLVKSYGSVDRALKGNVSEEELGLNGLKVLADDVVGKDKKEWFFGYRMIVGKTRGMV